MNVRHPAINKVFGQAIIGYICGNEYEGKIAAKQFYNIADAARSNENGYFDIEDVKIFADWFESRERKHIVWRGQYLYKQIADKLETKQAEVVEEPKTEKKVDPEIERAWNEDLTDLQRKMFECFPWSGHLYDYYDPKDPECGCGTWAFLDEWIGHMGCTMRQAQGVLTSLKNKGLIVTNGGDYLEGKWVSWIDVTPKGHKYLAMVTNP